MYGISIGAKLARRLHHLIRKARVRYAAAHRKMEEIANLGPDHFKNLRYRLKEYRRVHIDGSFVLLFTVDEERKNIVFEDLRHHDEVYRR
jgi:YafQ family addiction module toxin component